MKLKLKILKSFFAGEVLSVNQFPSTFGRSPECTYPFDLGDVSRVHFKIEEKEGEYLLSDMESSNGTYVNHQRISAPMILRDHDIIQAGSLFCQVVLVSERKRHAHDYPTVSYMKEELSGTPHKGTHIRKKIEETSLLGLAPEKLRRSYIALQIMYHVLKVCDLASDQEGLFDVLLNKIKEAFDADDVSIWINRKDGNQLVQKKYATGPEGTSPFSESMLQEVIQHGDSICTPHFGPENRSSICSPLVSSGQPCGGIYVVRKEKHHAPFKNTDLEILGAIGIQLGNTLEKIFLMHEVNQVNQEISHANELLRQEILERQKAEESLKKSKKMLEKTLDELKTTQSKVVQEERMSAMGRMASGIVHDFNNRLGGIIGFCELLTMRPQNLENKEKLQRYLHLIHTSARDAANVVDRLSNFYRNRKEKDLRVMTDVNGLVEEMVSLTESKWKNEALSEGKQIVIQKNLEEVPQIEANPHELRDALTNLIFNAVDAIEKEGTITFSTHREEGNVVLLVSDTGSGMSEAMRCRCFEPFFTTKAGKGTGLGLSSVFGTVQRHQGTVEIKSEPGKGTTFAIRFPFLPEPIKQASTTMEEVLSPKKILLVDDEINILEIITELLQYDGHYVESTSHALEGLKKFEQQKFDLVITDKGMPEMSGDSLAREIKKISKATPVLLITGFAHLDLQTMDGVDAILHKPVTLLSLRNAIASLVGKGNGLTSNQEGETI